MATVQQAPETVPPVVAKPPRVREAAAWHALAKMAEKEAKALRDELPVGSHAVNLQWQANVDGHLPMRILAHCVLTVGQDTSKAASCTPDYEGILAWLLESLNEQTREARLRDLVAVYKANGGKLPANDRTREAVKAALGKLRSTERKTQRGPVSCAYTTGEDVGTRK